MIDAPGEALQQMHKDSYAPLVKYERYEQFRTYLLWYPVPECRIPIARIDWSWSIIAEASPANTPVGKYPWKWERVDWETTPEAGKELLIEKTVEAPYSLGDDRKINFIAEDTPPILGLDWWRDAGYR